MASTTLPITSVGSPPDDPTCPLPGLLYIPDPTMFKPPYHCFVGTEAAGFASPGIQNGNKVFTSLVNNGFLVLAFQVRVLAPPLGQGIPGQTTTGEWHQQTDDMQIGIRYMRTSGLIASLHGFSVTGFVGTVGGSGSAHHALYKAIFGTAGDDKSDAAICLSPPTDFSDRTIPPVTTQFIRDTNDYATGQNSSSDLPTLLARSPISGDLAHAKPILQYNGDNEAMPLTQLTRMQAAMAAAGAVGYSGIENTGSVGTHHSWGMWAFIAPDAVAWALARAADFTNQGGGGTPPPPTQEMVTVQLTGMTASTPMEFGAAAIDKTTLLQGPTTFFDFITDRAMMPGTTKAAPAGVYDLVPGQSSDITGAPWLGYSYVNGSRWRTAWNIVQAGTPGQFQWAPVTTYLANCAAHNKNATISISAGITTPQFVYNQGAIPFTEHGPDSGTMPLPWDPVFITAYQKLIKSFAQNFDAHPNLLGVVMGGPWQLIETHMAMAGADYDALNTAAVAAGYADAAAGWTDGAQQIITYWIKAMNTTRCFLSIAIPFQGEGNGFTTILNLVTWATGMFGKRFGVMNAGLNGATSDMPQSINDIIHDNAATSPVGYQFGQNSQNPNCDPTQDPTMYLAELGLRNAAAAGYTAIGVPYEEFYEIDILTTAPPPPNGNLYPADFATFQTALLANAHG